MFIVAVWFSIFTKEGGYAALGYDIYGHLFKAEQLYASLLNGKFYPLYTTEWYNGLQLFRYWQPLSYYVLAGIMFITGGDVYNAMYVFTGCSIFFGGLAWLIIGKEEKRPSLGLTMSLVWFFLPDNYRVFYAEGNLPRMIIAILIPYYVFLLRKAVVYEKKYAAILNPLLVLAIILTDVKVALIIILSTAFYLALYSFFNKSFYQQLKVFLVTLTAIPLSGLYLMPAVLGKYSVITMASESAKVAGKTVTNLLSAFDAVGHFSGDPDSLGVFYFGISILILAIFGVFLANKKQLAGYWLCIIFLLFSSKPGNAILSVLPVSSLVNHQYFVTIIMGFLFLQFFDWRSLKRSFCVVLMLLVIADSLVSIIHIEEYYSNKKDRIEEDISFAKEIAGYRVALMDMSTSDSYPSYEICRDSDILYSFGWAWEGAATADNLSTVNYAFETKNYYYMFDRLLELGNDVVLVNKRLFTGDGFDKKLLLEAADAVGYEKVRETYNYITFKLPVNEPFGIVSKYDGIAIGSYAQELLYMYPACKKGESDFIDDYTVDMLKDYKCIMLSGISYHDKAKAEKLVRNLSDLGVRVVIDMCHVPEVPEKRVMEFLGVSSSMVSFSQNFPIMSMGDEYLTTKPFATEDEWITYYISNTPKTIGTAEYANHSLCFLGSDENENIYFIGFNLIFHSNEAEDTDVREMIDGITNLSFDELPTREIVPLKYSFENDELTFEAPKAYVNTTFAFQDNFVSDKIRNDNNLLTIEDEKVSIKIKYPHFTLGLGVTLSGIVLYILAGVYLYFGRKRSIITTEDGAIE
ncbi:MAG: hypothetical protein MJ113_01625 [Lachnospiraceae bacterium]|nr:hypothetical protein [Lachnospiraceae bacterium]